MLLWTRVCLSMVLCIVWLQNHCKFGFGLVIVKFHWSCQARKLHLLLNAHKSLVLDNLMCVLCIIGTCTLLGITMYTLVFNTIESNSLTITLVMATENLPTYMLYVHIHISCIYVYVTHTLWQLK